MLGETSTWGTASFQMIAAGLTALAIFIVVWFMLGTAARAKQDRTIAARMRAIGRPVRQQDAPTAPGGAGGWIPESVTSFGKRFAERQGFSERLASVIRASHERWDGDGYPDGLSGRAIPWPARIVFCADAYDAMTNARPYRGPMPARAACRELRRGAGTQFDPVVAQRLAATIERLDARFRRTPRDRDPAAVIGR